MERYLDCQGSHSKIKSFWIYVGDMKYKNWCQFECSLTLVFLVVKVNPSSNKTSSTPLLKIEDWDAKGVFGIFLLLGVLVFLSDDIYSKEASISW